MALKGNINKKTYCPKISALRKSGRKVGRPSRAKRGPIAAVFYALSVLGVWAVIVGIILFVYLAHDLPDYENPPKPGAGIRSIVVKAENGATLVRTGPIYGDFLTYNEIPKPMIHAIVAVEDRRFFDHIGIDGKGIARAAMTNALSGRLRQGGSTLTQQLAKNMFLTHKRTIKRKAQETLLAFWLEVKFSKQQILTLYLNRVYFGGGAYGVDAASRKFFGHSARKLSIAESAVLAGVVQSPSRLAPHINPQGAWKRGKFVLKALVSTGIITQEKSDTIAETMPFIVSGGPGINVRFFTDWITQQADKLLQFKGRSLIVHTTLDPTMQVAATNALHRHIESEGTTRNASEGALISMELDGAVKAMVGGYSYSKSQFNRAVLAKRQPGSTFKLFAYLAAIENGIKPSDIYHDKALTVEGWSPKNYSGKHYGDMALTEAFARSVNTIAVQVAEKTGRSKVAEMARRLGISTNISPVASLPLGTEEVRLIDLTGAYAAVANGGLKVKAYGIVEISSLEGEVLYRHIKEPPKLVLNQDTIEKITPMLKAVITSGSGRNASIDRPAAGKSGTTQDSRDAVFAGFTSDLTTGVWIGNDDNTPMKAVTGGGLPARVWSDFMLEAHAGQPVRNLHADQELYRSTYEKLPELLGTKPKKSLWEKIFGKKKK